MEATPSDKENSSTETLSATSQGISTLALGFAAMSFTLGLLIANLRLGYFGFYSSDLLRSEYVIVGAAFLVLSASAYLPVVYGYHQLRKVKEKWGRGSRLNVIFTALWLSAISVALPLMVLYYSSDGRLDPVKWRTWVSLFGLIAGGTWLTMAIARFWDVGKIVLAKKTHESLMVHAESSFSVLEFLPALLMSIVAYAHITYPRLMPALGGGQRGQVTLVMTNEGLIVAKKLGLPTQTGSSFVGPLHLLTESKDEIVIVVDLEDTDSQFTLDHPDASHAVRIDRRLIDATVARPWRKNQAWGQSPATP